MKLRRINRTKTLEFFTASTDTALERPFVEGQLKAGFPSPADDFSEVSIDLNIELLKNPASTFFCRVSGDSMEDMGISDGDLLIIDKSLEPADGKVAVCCIDGEFTLKSIRLGDNCCWLMPANKKYKPIKVTEANELIIWGIVTHSIKSF